MKQDKKHSSNTNIWDFLISITQKGNLIILFLGICSTIAFLRMPKSDISRSLLALVDKFKEKSMWGWYICIAVTLISIVSIFLLIKYYKNEIKRVCKERDDLQQKQIVPQIQSSKNNKVIK